MRFREILILPLLGALLAGASTASAATIVARWEFDGNYTDATGNYPTSGAGSAAFASPGLVGSGALSLTGTTAYAQTSGNFNQTAFNAGWSMLAWIYKPTTIDGALLSAVRSDTGDLTGFSVGIGANGGLSTFMRNTAGSGTLSGLTAAGVVSTGSWYHIGLTWDGTLGSGIQFYVNGAAVTTTPSGSGFAGFTGNVNPLRIGNSLQPTTGAFEGSIDHLLLYNGALSGAQILADFQATNPVPEPASLVALAGLAALALRRSRSGRSRRPVV